MTEKDKTIAISTIQVTDLLRLTQEAETRVGAVRFDVGYHDRGMDLLVHQGRLNVFPGGPIYVAPWKQIIAAIPSLLGAGVEFNVNYSIAKVPLRKANSLGEQDGWVKPVQES